MWLDELRLHDFRGFRDATLDLRRPLTVLVGLNGAGKTSIVDALELLASHAVPPTFTHPEPHALAEHDVRLGADSCSLELAFAHQTVRVTRDEHGRTGRKGELGPGDVPPLVIVLKSDRAVLRSPDPAPPQGIGLVARARVHTKHPAWDDVFQPELTAFELAESWFREREDLENQQRVNTRQLDLVDPGLALARAAIEAALPGYRDARIDRALVRNGAGSQLVLRKGDQQLTADMLSEGERSLLVLTLTIARRLSLLPDPSVGAVVVIDEIELHLHPKWQREILPALLGAFPTCQFIVTTHSPQVIGSVPRGSLFVIEDFTIYPCSTPTEGRDSNAILDEIMGTSERSDASKRKLDEIAALIDHGEIDAARAAIDDLAGGWGDDDREVVRLRTALEFREI